MTIELIKGHGSENDFFIVDNTSGSLDYAAKKHLSLLLCQRNNLLGGADGVLYMEKGKGAPYQMRIFNADGSEALMCGNGMRLAGRWSAQQLKCDHTTVENVTGLSYNITIDNAFYKNVHAISTVFPPADLEQDFINNTPLHLNNQTIGSFDTARSYTAIAMPNPHIIAYVAAGIDDVMLKAIGEEANSDIGLFPQGVNVSWVQFIDAHTIFVSTYERGVGLTNACGTAMIASAITGVQLGLLSFNEEIKVKNKGGFIKVEVKEDWSSVMTGNATFSNHYTVVVEKEEIVVTSHIATNEQVFYDLLKSDTAL